MAVQQIMVPYRPGYEFGIGADLATGSPMGKVVQGEISGVHDAGGAVVDFQVQRIMSTADLETALGVDVEASYGCGAFGAGVSARFNFAKKSKVQSSSLFMAISATVQLEFLQIDDPVLTANAISVQENPDIFKKRYGNMFVRGIARGGVYVGVLRVDTGSSEESMTIAAELEGSYGLFSADAKMKFEEVQRKYRNEVFVRMYHEGGPVDLRINDPQNPIELLDNANKFLESFATNPASLARPYAVTLAPVDIAHGPLPPNQAELENRQDILVLCAKRRSTLLDQLNLLDFIKSNPSKFDFSNGADKTAIERAAVDTELDLDFIAECASRAMSSAREAVYPAALAQERGETFPRSTMPDPLPLPKGGKIVTVPDFSRCSSWSACAELAAKSGLGATQEIAQLEPGNFKVLGFSPSKGAEVPEGTVVTIVTHPVKRAIRVLGRRRLNDLYYRPIIIPR